MGIFYCLRRGKTQKRSIPRKANGTLLGLFDAQAKYNIMAKGNIPRKHFLYTAGATLAGFVGLGVASSTGKKQSSEAQANRLASRIRKAPETVPYDKVV